MDWLRQGVITSLIAAAIVALIKWIWDHSSRGFWSFILAGILVIILLFIAIFLLIVPSWQIITLYLIGAIATWMPVTLLLQKVQKRPRGKEKK